MAVTRHSSFDITVSTIADRNALLRKVNHMTVLVRDAIADINAGAGKATYRYDAYDDTWILVSRSKTDTISFDTEELTIVNGKVTPANIILDNQVWGLAIIQNDQIFIEPRMSDLIIDYTGISGLDDYNGMTLKFTYAYGSQAGQVSSIIQDAVNTVETELALKANSADVYTKSQVDSKIVELAPATDISGKADITYVDTELALKANSVDVYTKIESDSLLSDKASTTYVDTELALKANSVEVYTKIESDSLLSDKASTTYVDSGLNNIHTQIDNVIVGNDIMPKVSGISNIGSATNKFGAIYTKEMHIDANTLYVDGVPVLGSSANTINISADTNQGIRVATKGTGQTVLDSETSTVIKTNGINADVLIESQGTGSRSRITSDSSVIITAPVISLEGSISGSSTSDLTFRNITATGNLTVQGSTTFVDSTNVSIKDNVIVLNKGELGTGVSLGYAGIQIDRGDDADSRIVWNEASDKFIMGILGSEKNIASEDFVTSAINAIPSVDFSGYYTKAQIDTSLGNKVDKVTGKGLSTEDYTTAEKTKLSGIEVNANNYILPVASSTVLGGVKAGTNISIDANGVISANDSSVAWSEVTAKPTTIGGYAITDAYTKTDVDTSLGNKVDKVTGKGLSTEDYTTAEKTKLAGIEAGATGDMTATEILNAIKTVDGSSSGLDADLLDGMQPTAGSTPNTIVSRDANGSFSSGVITGNGSGNDYYTGGLNTNGNGSANTIFPTLGFHQPQVYASSLQLRGASDFRFYNQGATGYANVTANTFIGSLSGNASTATNASYADNANTLSGYSASNFLLQDGWDNAPGKDANLQSDMKVDFTYANNAPFVGPLVNMGVNGYSMQFNTLYWGSSRLAFRSKNGDNQTWNGWKEVAFTDSSIGVVASSNATNGYVKFGNGTIIQWMTWVDNGQWTNRSFPIAFPNACTGISFTPSSGGDTVSGSVVTIGSVFNASQVRIGFSGGNGWTIRMIAIGY